MNNKLFKELLESINEGAKILKEITQKRKLHVYANDVTEWVIAYSPEDAIKVWEELVGETHDLENFGEFYQEDDEKKITFFNEDENTEIPKNAEKISELSYRATFREWADTLGRSFFCSTEY